MSENAKRAIVWIAFTAGLILGLIGWVTETYSSWTGTIIFLGFAFATIALRIFWGLSGRNR